MHCIASWDEVINKSTITKVFSTHAIIQVNQCWWGWNRTSLINICNSDFVHVNLYLVSSSLAVIAYNSLLFFFFLFKGKLLYDLAFTCHLQSFPNLVMEYDLYRFHFVSKTHHDIHGFSVVIGFLKLAYTFLLFNKVQDLTFAKFYWLIQDPICRV